MIPLIHFYSTMTICQVEYMNQSVLNDIRNNGYIRYDGDIYNYKYEKVHSIHDEILQICNKDSNPDLWEIMSKHGNHYKCMKFLNGCSDDQFPMIPEMALSQMEWVEWWKNYERSTPTRSLHLHNNNLNNSTTSRKRKHINF